MAVQIPTLERDAVPQPASVGRLDYNPINVAGIEQPVANAVQSTASDLTKYARSEAAYAANTASLAASNKFHQWYEDQLEGRPDGVDPNTGEKIPGIIGARQKDGDPAPVYSKLNSDATQQMTGIMASYADAPEPTRIAIAQGLQGVRKKFYDRQQTAFSAQQMKYVNAVSDQSVQQTQKDALDATANISADDPDSLQPFDQKVNEIKVKRLQQGAKLGMATPDPKDPKIDPSTGLATNYTDVSPSLAMKIAKNTSDTVLYSINNLAAAGNVQEAKLLLDKYQKVIDPVNRAKVDDKIEKAVIDQNASKAASAVQDMPMDKAIQKIKDQFDDSDPIEIKTRDAALKKVGTYQALMKAASDQQTKNNFNAGTQQIYNGVQSGSLKTPDQAISDPIIQGLIDTGTIDAHQIKAWKEMVTPSKDSDPKALTEAFNRMKFYDDPDKGLKGRDFSDVIQDEVGLDQAHRHMYEDAWKKANTVTPSELDKQKSQLNKIAEQSLIELGVNGDKDLGIREIQNKKGQYTTKDQIKLNTFLQGVYADAPTKVMGPKEQQDWVNDRIIKMIQNKPKQTGWFNSFFGGADEGDQKFIKTHNSPQPLPSKEPGSAEPALQPSTNAASTGVTKGISPNQTAAIKSFIQDQGHRPDFNNPNDVKKFNEYLNGK